MADADRVSGRPLGTLQVDVDELWVYYESLGLPSNDVVASPVYTVGVPRLLDLLERYEVRATFFVCGRDLEHPLRRDVAREIVRRGHELANHSYSHLMGFARLQGRALKAEVMEADARIAQIYGRPVYGFRAPGYSLSPRLLKLLDRAGYLYDASLLPTPWTWLMRWGQRLVSHGRVDAGHYGVWAYGWAPLSPYHPDLEAPQRRGDARLWEVPVTTMPWLRLPFHSTFVATFGWWLFRLGLRLLLRRGLGVHYVIHPAELIDPVRDPRLSSFRFLRVPWSQKRPLYEAILHHLSEAYCLVPTAEYVGARPSPPPQEADQPVPVTAREVV
ncbi:MAG: polysaccharide deacetylase family protein [Chloroflexi bacterium]|nr:polysaccharide deacetylase family protein [Chloroflexota bacterium]